MRPTSQRQGIGHALLVRTAKTLHEQGAERLEIGCVRENPSCGFYRRLAGIEIGRRPVKVDRYETEEILFDWPDLKRLAHAVQPS